MNSIRKWQAVFLLLWAAILTAQAELVHAQEKQRTEIAEKVDAAQIDKWISELALDDYQSRNSASIRLYENRDAAIPQVLLYSLSPDSEFSSAAECLNLLEKWLRGFDPEVHERVRKLLDEHCKGNTHRQTAEGLVRRFLDEGFECSEAQAVVLISMMGASVHWIKDEGYYSISSRGDCSREEGDSLWPLRNIQSNCLVMFEDEHTVDDFTTRNLAFAPGLKTLFCPKMTKKQIAMLGNSKSLEVLYLRDVISDEATIKALTKIPNLELLSFNPMQPIEMMQHLHLFPALKKVFTNRSDIRDPRLLDYFAACPKLETLDLSSFKMPGEKFQDLGRFKNVTNLELPWRVDDTLIKNAAAMPSLEVLEIKKAIITDAAAPFLANHKNLRKLSIEHSFITDATCTHLAKLTKLKELKLDGTFVTPAGVALIEKAIPRLEVDGWITSEHAPEYVEALQQLQLIGCTVQPNFGVSYERDENGNAMLPYSRLPGCDVFFDLTDDADKNARFVQYAKNVNDLGSLRITGCDDAFAQQLIQLPASAEVFFIDCEVSDETIGKLKSHLKKVLVSK